MYDQMLRFLKDEEGATAIEYALLAALIAAAIAATVGAVGTTLDGVFTQLDADIQGT